MVAAAFYALQQCTSAPFPLVLLISATLIRTHIESTTDYLSTYVCDRRREKEITGTKDIEVLKDGE